MIKKFIYTAIGAACFLFPAHAQNLEPINEAAVLIVAAPTKAVFTIDGEWIYRSLHNNSDIDAEFNDLAFGKGAMRLSVKDHVVAGALGGPGWSLALKGYYAPDGRIRFQGKGMIAEEEWIYDYEGRLVMPWPHEIDQRPAIVGSVIRTKTHSNGKSPAGYVASFIAVKK